MENPLSDDLDHILNRTQDVWPQLKDKRIFITGGTGFFGCWLLESILWANKKLGTDIKATVLTRAPEKFIKKAPHLASDLNVKLMTGDVTDFPFPKGSFPFVIHAATEASAKLDKENPEEMYKTIATGTERVLQFCKDSDTEMMLLTSSGAVYGPQPPEIENFSEADVCKNPDQLTSAYARGKLQAENMCLKATMESNLKIKIARGFAFVGPYLPLNIHFAIGNFIRDALAGETITIKGDGTPRRSYLYAADLCIWLWTILLKGKNGSAYNVGSEKDYSIEEAALTVCNCFKPGEKKAEVLTPKQTNKPIQRYIPSTKKARTELGLREHINLHEGIIRTIQWDRIRRKLAEEML